MPRLFCVDDRDHRFPCEHPCCSGTCDRLCDKTARVLAEDYEDAQEIMRLRHAPLPPRCLRD